MVSGTKSSEKVDIWNTIYPKNSVDIYKGKKQGNILNLLGGISILGDSKTSDIAKFVLSYGKTEGYASELKYRDYHSLQDEYSRLFSNRLMYSSGGKKIIDTATKKPKRYSNPIDYGYVFIVGKPKSTKGIPTPKYFLTLKGFFLIVGYDLTPSELKSMIYNASEISMFFCFIKTVLDNTSIDFVTDIFIKPIQKVLSQSNIFQGGNLDFYFSIFADSISLSLSEKMKTISEKRKQKILKKPDSYFSKKITREYMQLHPTRIFSDLVRIKKREELQDIDDLLIRFKKEGIESLMENVFYSDNPPEDWYDSLFDHFYPSKSSPLFLLKFGHDTERTLLYKVMQSVSLAYSYFDYGILPYKEKKLPRSKAWKRHRRFKKSASGSKPMREFDISNL